MKTTLEECPKAFKKYKKWLINGLKKKYPKTNVEGLMTDVTLKASIDASPMACTYFFDSLNQVGTLHYNDVDSAFICMVNNEPTVDLTQSSEVGRLEREKSLIKYLFKELEKTL